jgi:hypothetical protein
MNVTLIASTVFLTLTFGIAHAADTNAPSTTGAAVRVKRMMKPWLTRRRGFFPSALGVNMSILWTILIGFIAGVLAKLITPGSNEPQGFILTTILGIVGGFVAAYLGQALGWYRR